MWKVKIDFGSCDAHKILMQCPQLVKTMFLLSTFAMHIRFLGVIW